MICALSLPPSTKAQAGVPFRTANYSIEEFNSSSMQENDGVSRDRFGTKAAANLKSP